MNESTMVPDDIEVLLECLQSSEDLQLEEMEPLRKWADAAPDGELEISKALARNSLLGQKLEDAEIVVPKMLQRNVHAYVLKNARAAADELVAEQAKKGTQNKSQPPKRNPFSTRLQFSVGVVCGLAIVVLAGFFVSQRFYSDLNANQLAQEAEGWFDSLEKDDDREWNSDWPLEVADFEVPFEISARKLWSTKVKTKYGKATVLELAYKPQAPNQRAMLFLFNSTRSMSETTLSASPQYVTEKRCVGVAKRGETVYALVVDGDRADYAALIQGGNALGQMAALNQIYFRTEGLSVSLLSSFEASF